MAKPDPQRVVRDLLREGPPLLPKRRRRQEMRPDERSALRRWLDSFASKEADPAGLTRRGDWIPGVQQALAARDFQELGQAREELTEDAPWYADPLMRGAQGLSALGVVPMLGGILSMPRRAALEMSEDIIGRTRKQGGMTIDPLTGRDPETGVSVGGRVPGTELKAPVGTTTPEQLVEHLERVPVDPNKDRWAKYGGWLDTDPETGETFEYFDIPELFTGPNAEYEASLEAALRGELASWNIGAGREIRTPPGRVIEGATHRAFSPLGELDVTRAGENTSLRGRERHRASAPYFAPPKGYLGVPGVYRGEPGLGPELHTARLRGIFDPKQDPETAGAIRQQLDEAMRELGSTDRAQRETLLEQALIDRGYTGYTNPNTGVIATFQNVPLQYGGRLQGPYLGPQYGLLAGMEGSPRLPEMQQTPLRDRRFARQRQVEADMFRERIPKQQYKGNPRKRPLPRSNIGPVTVRQPEGPQLGPAFPGVYKPAQQVVGEAEAAIGPESRYLRDVFDVSRQDVYEGFLEQEKEALRRGYRMPQPRSATVAPHVQNIMTPENERRIKDVLRLSSEVPDLKHSYGWYWNDPLYQQYVQVLGPDEGLKQWLNFHQQGSALSASSAVPKELERTSYFDFLRRQGRPEEFLTGPSSDLPTGLGHVAHTSAHRKPLERMRETGFFAETNPLQGVKTGPYFGAKTGTNIWTPIIDAHHARSLGLPDVRPWKYVRNKKTGEYELLPAKESVQGYEGSIISPWYNARIANPLGMRGVGAQAQQWTTFGPQTNIDSPLGAPFLEILANLAAHVGEVRGQDPKEALHRFIAAEQDLFEPGFAQFQRGLYGR